MGMLRSDKLRGFRVDVESDSTIRADLTRNQQNMTQFLQGTAQFAQAMGPIVMTFKEMTPAIIDVYSSFARNFKLGKQAEDALDKLSTMAQQAAQAPPKPDPQMQMEQQKMQMEQAKLQAEQQAKQAELEMKAQESQQKIEADRVANEQKLAFEAQKHEQEMQFEREKHQNDMAMQSQQMAMQQQQHEQTIAVDREKAESDFMVKREGIQAQREEGEAGREFERDKASLPKRGEIAATMEKVASGLEAIKAIQQSIEDMAKEAAEPVEIIRDKSGRSTGAKKGKRVMTIQRGADGRAASIQ
jgi:hypothetical protein